MVSLLWEMRSGSENCVFALGKALWKYGNGEFALGNAFKECGNVRNGIQEVWELRSRWEMCLANPWII